MEVSSLTMESLLGDVLWQTTAALLAGLVASTVLGRWPSRAHRVLLLCIAAAVVTPMLTLGFRFTGWGFLPGLNIASVDAPTASTVLLTDHEVVGSLSWLTVAAAVWITLSVLATTRLAVSISRARRLLADATPIDDDGVLDAARRAAMRLGLQCRPRLYYSDHVRCPVIWCWGRRPRVLLPTGSANDELFAVLCHELAHFRRRDHLASLLGELAMCVLPWHPLSWLANRRLRDLSEHSCDTWVLASGASPTNYAETLLAMMPQTRMILAPAAVNGGHSVVRRIRRILDRRPSEPQPPRRWTTTCALATVLIVGTVAMAHRRPLVIMVEPGAHPIAAVPVELDLGIADPGTTRSGRLWLLNRGGASHQVLDVSASCGCTTVSGFEPGEIAHGETMAVVVTMTAPDQPGQRKTKHVTFSIEGQPPLKVAVHLVAASPDS